MRKSSHKFASRLQTTTMSLINSHVALRRLQLTTELALQPTFVLKRIRDRQALRQPRRQLPQRNQPSKLFRRRRKRTFWQQFVECALIWQSRRRQCSVSPVKLTSARKPSRNCKRKTKVWNISFVHQSSGHVKCYSYELYFTGYRSDKSLKKPYDPAQFSEKASPNETQLQGKLKLLQMDYKTLHDKRLQDVSSLNYVSFPNDSSKMSINFSWNCCSQRTNVSYLRIRRRFACWSSG